MAESVVPGPISDLSAVREATCIHTQKIYDACQAKDCMEDLRLYPIESDLATIDLAQSVKLGQATLLYVQSDVAAMGFHQGYYTIDLRYYYQVSCDVYTGTGRPTSVTGLAVSDKRAMLFGGDGTSKLFTSDDTSCAESLGASVPRAVVEAVDPILLQVRLTTKGSYPAETANLLTEVPACIEAAFSDSISLANDSAHRIYLTLGQFSLLRLERDAQLLIPIYDHCMPDKECACDRCDDTPCEIFQQVTFPVNQFFPPAQSEQPDALERLRRGGFQ
jgi:hypothetical protein